MFPWQRKEVHITGSEDECIRVRSILSENNIKYNYNIKSRNQFFRDDSSFLGRYGILNTTETIYYVYVNKKDYEYAEQILRNAGK